MEFLRSFFILRGNIILTRSFVQFSGKHDLHRETAFNLSLIYRASGNELIARELLRKHCCI